MTGDTSLSISLVVLIIGVLLNVYGFLSNRKRDIKTDVGELASIRESLIKVDVKTGQLMSSVDEIKSDVRRFNDRITVVEKDIVEIRNQVKTLYVQIESMKGGMHEQSTL